MEFASEVEKIQNTSSLCGALVVGGTSINVTGSSQGDIIGCYLDLDNRLAHWTKNGVTAANMTISIAQFPPETVFYPACAIRVRLGLYFEFLE